MPIRDGLVLLVVASYPVEIDWIPPAHHPYRFVTHRVSGLLVGRTTYNTTKLYYNAPQGELVIQSDYRDMGEKVKEYERSDINPKDEN